MRPQLGTERRVGIGEQVDEAAGLDDAAVVEPGDRVGDLEDGVHLVGDEHDRQVQVVAQLAQQLDDRGGRRRVEPGGRLVGQQHRRPQGERAGDADPLALAAGELERVVAGALGRAHPVE